MKERPILFSGPMVEAILSGHKTQTRRIAKERDFFISKKTTAPDDIAGYRVMRNNERGATFEGALVGPCPYGKPGDRLWVRENCWAHKDTGEIFAYCAVDPTLYDHNHTVKKVPSIHMPRSKCRIVLQITSVRVERLQDISEADAVAEGCRGELVDFLTEKTARYEFSELWKSINGPDSWMQNPWVWVIEFERIPS